MNPKIPPTKPQFDFGPFNCYIKDGQALVYFRHDVFKHGGQLTKRIANEYPDIFPHGFRQAPDTWLAYVSNVRYDLFGNPNDAMQLGQYNTRIIEAMRWALHQEWLAMGLDTPQPLE